MSRCLSDTLSVGSPREAPHGQGCTSYMRGRRESEWVLEEKGEPWFGPGW